MPSLELVPDCGSCAGLCCVATCFDASPAFALSKEAGARCVNLTRDNRCAIHAEREERGFSGCVSYTCYGAGQRITRAFAHPRLPEATRDAAFLALREIHEILWLLREGAKRCPAQARELAAAFEAEVAAWEELAESDPREVVESERGVARRRAEALLRRLGAELSR